MAHLLAAPCESKEQNKASLYKPLKYAEDSIRLLELQQGEKNDHLLVSLQEVRLSQNPKYEALSYTWGDFRETNQILVDGRQVVIRQNLWAFLCALRLVDRPRLLWVDALSISQEDPLEKTRQVQIIGRIFSSAQSVLVWLGPAIEGSADLFRIAQDIQYEDGESRTKAWDKISIEEDRQGLKQTLDTLHANPYWTRTWIIQECILAKSIIIYCGSSSVSWERFGLFHNKIRGHGPAPQRYTWGSPHHGVMFDHIHSQRANSSDYPTNLGVLTSYFSYTASLDPRDFIYSLLSLAKESQPSHPARLKVDYTLPTTSLYFLACHAFLCNDPAEINNVLQVITMLRRRLKLEAEEIMRAIIAELDPSTLYSSPSEITGGPYEERNKFPNLEKPMKKYSFVEALFVDFRRLASCVGTVSQASSLQWDDEKFFKKYS